MSHQGDKDKDIPQWLEITFEKKKKKVELPKVTLQQAIIEEPRKVKKPKVIHHLLRIGFGEVVADVVVPLHTKGKASPKY